MRKDLKIGLAIGAVLLVLVIVYVVATPKPENGELAAAGGTDGAGLTDPAAAPGADTDAEPAEIAPPEAEATEPAPPSRPPVEPVARDGERDVFDPGAEATS